MKNKENQILKALVNFDIENNNNLDSDDELFLCYKTISKIKEILGVKE